MADRIIGFRAAGYIFQGAEQKGFIWIFPEKKAEQKKKNADPVKPDIHSKNNY